MRPGGNRGWLLRLVIAFACTQGAVSMARPAVSYRALALGADERAIGVIAGAFALLPLFAAVPLGRRTDHGRCAPLLTGNRLGQVAAPAAAGLVAGAVGVAAPFVMLGALLLLSSGIALRSPAKPEPVRDEPRRPGVSLRRKSDT